MKDFFDKTFGWLKVSNRMKHLKAGLIIYCLIVVLCAALLSQANSEVATYAAYLLLIEDLHNATSTILGLVCVLIAMLSVEYTQHNLCGRGKFDWLDVLAGCLPAIVFTILIFILT